jgi:hypothetical protein
MSTLGIYIFNSTRNQWYASESHGLARWGSFNAAAEFSGDDPDVVERIRERVSGDDVTFTMAALH